MSRNATCSWSFQSWGGGAARKSPNPTWRKGWRHRCCASWGLPGTGLKMISGNNYNLWKHSHRCIVVIVAGICSLTRQRTGAGYEVCFHDSTPARVVTANRCHDSILSYHRWERHIHHGRLLTLPIILRHAENRASCLQPSLIGSPNRNPWILQL